MYLKSLVLKGFKSFADRTVLTLKPGITAVVGPNGSGKSNISDAVLWVLGERNAKHLRGAAMEDVIFAGTPTRKPAGVAEVDLVLDNSDGTLPVDYSEVVITRRAYRSESGSEYLINGTPARRIDVLNILHDSGLGTGTHSIISQGALDSILQSKPEDRRALIEEAAGVLKHKQRKEKSERKLGAMEQHVARVRDVVGEVSRQLGPLERKAKRALKYQELSAELADATLQLAVDDLRSLQRSWEAVKGKAEGLSVEEEKARQAVEKAEQDADALQERIESVRVDADEMNRQQQAASAAAERLSSATLLVRERRDSARVRTDELDAQGRAAADEVAAAEQALTAAEAEAVRAAEAHAQVRAQVEALEEGHGKLAAERDGLMAEHDACEAKRAEAAARREELRTLRDEAREALSQGRAQMQVLDARLAELEPQEAALRGEAEAADAALEEARGAYEALQAQEAEGRPAVGERFQAREAGRLALDEARAEHHAIAAQIEALEEIERAEARKAGAAQEWMLGHAADLAGSIEPLVQVVRARAGYEAIVESLLAADVAALLIDDAACAERAAALLADAAEPGALTLLLRRDPVRPPADPAEGVPRGTALMSQLDYPDEAAAAVHALLGDVVVVDTLADALAAHGADVRSLRFAARDGSVVWPTGKVTLGAAVLDEGQGALARARHRDELRTRLDDAARALDEAQGASSAADEAWRVAQAASNDLAQAVAAAQGTLQSASAEQRRAADALAAAERNLAQARAERERASASLADVQPASERFDDQIAAQDQAARAAEERLAELSPRLAEVTGQAKQAADALAKARVELVQLAERDTYAVRMRETRAGNVEAVRARIGASRAEQRTKRAAAERLDALLGLVSAIQAHARTFSTNVNEHVRKAQSSTTGLYEQARAAAEERRRAQAALNAVQDSMNAVQVERARISMQVDAAQQAIVEDCATPLETALELPALEDRAEVEDAAAALARRIANLGTINPDAASEYEELKARFDYLQGQLDDLDSARRSLAKINRIIDARMKDDFIRTFEEVDGNFQRIFAVLFPGGQAHLSLVDPDDVEGTGVEVNAQPAGKRIAKMSLMSGGEKSLTALALLFAVYATRATPFYILDEVEAALDDTNLRRLVAYIEQLRDSTQLIMITHQRRTMEMADVLFGLSMQGDGVTTVLSQTLSQALRYAE